MKKLIFEQLKQKERVMLKVKHEVFDTQIIVADMLHTILEIPKWKIWVWIPKARYVFKREQAHKNCCGFKLD